MVSTSRLPDTYDVPGFRRVPVRAELAEATGLPTIVDNDANTAAYAEIKVGVARGVQDALVITLGTGIGGGVIVGGRVLRGANGFAAEIGHFQIDPAGETIYIAELGFRVGNTPCRHFRHRYYAPPGHTPVLYAGTEVVEFSPTDELQRTFEAVEKNMTAAG